MKLTKKKLEKVLTPSLEKLGYTRIKDTISGFQGLFVKKVSSDLFLTLGLTIHRYYDDAFTGNFYLSKTTRIGSVWGDIPEKSYERIGYLLTDEELKNYGEEGAIWRDVWWEGLVPASVDDFVFRVQQCEPRICNDKKLREQIEKSLEVKKLYEYSMKIIEIVNKLPIRDDYKFIPPKEVDDIPIKWFKAAELVLCSSNGIINKNAVKYQSSDAFIQYYLNNKI